MLHDANVVFAIEAAFAMVTTILLTPMSPNDSPPQRDWQSNFCEPTVIQTNAWWDGIAAPPLFAGGTSKRSLRSLGSAMNNQRRVNACVWPPEQPIRRALIPGRE